MKQNRLEDFLKDAPIGLHKLTPNGLILWANQAELDLLGYQREEYIGHHIGEFHAQMSAAEEILQRLARNDTLHNHKASLRCKDGTIKQVLLWSKSLWESGRLIHTYCFTLDMTELTNREKSFREMTAKYRGLLESTREGLYEIDLRGHCTFVNQAAARMLDYRPDEILGRHMHTLIHHSRVDGSLYRLEWCPVYRTLRTGLKCRIEGEVFWHRDGTQFPVEYSSYPVSEKGMITGAVVMFTDITERQRTIQAFGESETQFRQLAQHIREVFWISNPERSRILYINSTYEDIWDRSSTSLYASIQSWIESIHPDDRERVRSILRTKQVHAESDLEYRILRPDGSIRWIRDRAFPIRDQSGEVSRLVGIAEDITHYKRASEDLQQLSSEARAFSSYIEAAREQELSHIGQKVHDDLGGVLTYLKLDLTRLCQNIAEVTIGEASQQLQSKFHTMITMETRPVLLDYAGLIAAVIWQAREFEGRTGIRCVFTASPNVGEVSKDQSLLVFRIFQEALTNIARHAHADTVRISLHKDNDYLTLAIQDDGRGIPAREISNPTSFGLQGMRERARLAGGQLSISGAEGEGTTVAVRIPIRTS
jgi:PAS domain S-box-containing protein